MSRRTHSKGGGREGSTAFETRRCRAVGFGRHGRSRCSGTSPVIGVKKRGRRERNRTGRAETGPRRPEANDERYTPGIDPISRRAGRNATGTCRTSCNRQETLRRGRNHANGRPVARERGRGVRVHNGGPCCVTLEFSPSKRLR